jgi:hypothetical protein
VRGERAKAGARFGDRARADFCMGGIVDLQGGGGVG